MIIELYLLFLSIYILLIGLFIKRLTNLWLWSSFGLSLSSFIFFFSGFKNLILVDFFYTFNLASIFFWILLIITSCLIFNQFSTFARDLISWLVLILFFWGSKYIFVGDFSSFQISASEQYWLGTYFGGCFHHDLKLLILFICLIVFISVYHRGVNYYDYDYIVLILLGCLASLLLLTQDNLVLLYLDLELQALVLYVLTTYYRFEESNTEAGLKYLLIGSLVSGFFLIGTFIFYFYNGSLTLSEFSFVEGQTWFFATFIFKLGAAPFYFWTPSVYQQMDYPTLAFVSIVPKLSIWFLIFKSFDFLTISASFLYWAGILSVIIGAIGGLYQLSLNSLIAYSGVLNSGYLLLFCDQAQNQEIIFMVGFYLIGYYFVLGVLLASFSFFHSNFVTDFFSFKTLGATFSLVIYYFFLSLGGLPVVPGFSTKVFLLGYSVERNFFETFLIVFSSLFAVLYYLRVSGFLLFNVDTESRGHNQYRTSYGPNILYKLKIILIFSTAVELILNTI